MQGQVCSPKIIPQMLSLEVYPVKYTGSCQLLKSHEKYTLPVTSTYQVVKGAVWMMATVALVCFCLIYLNL